MDRLVVIIPGYYGSLLSDDDGDCVWIDAAAVLNPRTTMEALTLTPQTWNRLHPSGILDEIHLLPFLCPDVYRRLQRFLLGNLEIPEALVRSFYYDWRKPVDEAADQLERQLSRWFTSTGTSQVDLIAHSYGGLVARAFLSRHGQRAVDSVHRLITIGTPHKGMLKTMQALTEGIDLGFFTRSMTKATARTFPSAYELVPQAAADELFRWDDKVDSAHTNHAWCESTTMQQLLAEAQARLAASLDPTLPVPSCLIYGTRCDTLVQATGVPGAKVKYHRNDAGDTTVPMVSARGDGLDSVHTLHRYPIPYGGHMMLFNDPVTEDILTDLLIRDRAPEVHFVARFAQEKFYRPNRDNQLVVELTDAQGQPIDNATVTLEITTPPRPTVTLDQDVNGDYCKKVRMPGFDSAFRCTVTATAPGLSKTYRRAILLVSSS